MSWFRISTSFVCSTWYRARYPLRQVRPYYLASCNSNIDRRLRWYDTDELLQDPTYSDTIKILYVERLATLSLRLGVRRAIQTVLRHFECSCHCCTFMLLCHLWSKCNVRLTQPIDSISVTSIRAKQFTDLGRSRVMQMYHLLPRDALRDRNSADLFQNLRGVNMSPEDLQAYGLRAHQ